MKGENKLKHTPKPLQDLDLLDRFLFAEAMEDPVMLQHVLEIILNKDIALWSLPQTEKDYITVFQKFCLLPVHTHRRLQYTQTYIPVLLYDYHHYTISLPPETKSYAASASDPDIR